MSGSPQCSTDTAAVRQKFINVFLRKGYDPQLGVMSDAIEAFNAIAGYLDNAQAAPEPNRHTVIETAIRSYCRCVSSSAIQNSHGIDRIYYSGLSIADLVNEIEAALATPQPASNAYISEDVTPKMVSAGMAEIPEDGCEYEHVEAAYRAMRLVALTSTEGK